MIEVKTGTSLHYIASTPQNDSNTWHRQWLQNCGELSGMRHVLKATEETRATEQRLRLSAESDCRELRERVAALEQKLAHRPRTFKHIEVR